MKDIFPLSEEQERLVADLLAYMTLEEKLGQLALSVPAPAEPDAAFDKAVAGGRIGGVAAIADRDRGQALQRIAVERSRLGIPLLLSPRQTEESNLSGYSPWAIAASWDCQILDRLGKDIAARAREIGCQRVCGPRILAPEEFDSAIAGDLCAAEPRLLARLIASMIRGIQSIEDDTSPPVLATLDPGANAGRESDFAVLSVLRAAIREARVGAIDGPALPATLSKPADITDIASLAFAYPGIRFPECRRLIDRAGGERGWTLEQAQRALDDGRLTMGAIDDAVRGVLAAKSAVGLIRDPFAVYRMQQTDPASKARGRQTGLELTRRAMVLLRNEGGLLPLRSDFEKILIVGPPEGIATACADGLDNYGIACRTLPGLALRGQDDSYGEVSASDPLAIALTCDAARRADIVLLALDPTAFAPKDDGLPGLNPSIMMLIEALAHAQPNIVAILGTETPMDLGKATPLLPGILLAWNNQEELPTALAEILTGDCAPTGRLPMAITSSETEACYPFGHGLGYSEIGYADFAVDQASDCIVARLTLRNFGPFEALETVQAYIRRPGSIEAALTDFQRITLPPGETCHVEFRLGARQIGVIGADGRLNIAPGHYEIRVGKDTQRVFAQGIDISDQAARAINLGRALRTVGTATGTSG